MKYSTVIVTIILAITIATSTVLWIDNTKAKEIITNQVIIINDLRVNLSDKTKENIDNINKLSTISTSINNLIEYDQCYIEFCSGSAVYNVNTKENYILIYISDNTAHVITTKGEVITLDVSLLRHK